MELFPSLKERLDYLHLQDFLNYEYELHLKQPLIRQQRKIIAAYHTSNCRLDIEVSQWSTIPISRDTRVCHSCSYNAVENEAHLELLECPLYKPIRNKCPSLFEDVGLGSLKSFFQLDHQVDINLYLTKATALHHSKELASLRPPWCTFNPIHLFLFPYLTSMSAQSPHPWIRPSPGGWLWLTCKPILMVNLLHFPNLWAFKTGNNQRYATLCAPLVTH